jgi:mono/diheme cytochrome c family protein
MKISRIVSPLLYLLLIPAVVLAGDGEKVAALDANNCAPAGDLRGDPANGQVLHVEHCAACHGLTGQADVVVMHMDETPPDQSDPEYMKNLPDPYLYLAICKGGEGIGKSYVMSPWGDFFSDQEIRDLIGWMRTFSAT